MFQILMNYIYGDLYKNDKEENDPPSMSKCLGKYNMTVCITYLQNDGVENVANTLAILEQIKTEEVDRELERRKRKVVPLFVFVLSLFPISPPNFRETNSKIVTIGKRNQ